MLLKYPTLYETTPPSEKKKKITWSQIAIVNLRNTGLNQEKDHVFFGKRVYTVHVFIKTIITLFNQEENKYFLQKIFICVLFQNHWRSIKLNDSLC